MPRIQLCAPLAFLCLVLAAGGFAQPIHAALPDDAERQDADAQDTAKRERDIRALQTEVAKLQDRYDKLIKRCTGDNRNRPDARACNTARVTYMDVQQLKKRINALAEQGG